MAQEDFEGYLSKHLGNVIDAVVEWGKRYTNIDLQSDHDKLATAIADLAQATTRFTSQIDTLKSVLRDMEGNTYLDSREGAGELTIRDAETGDVAFVTVRDVIARYSGQPTHRLSEKANQSDVNNLIAHITSFSGLKDINKEDFDTYIDYSMTHSQFSEWSRENCGIYRVMARINKNPIRTVVGYLFVFTDSAKRAIVQNFMTMYNTNDFSTQGTRIYTWSRYFSLTTSFGVLGNWSEWEDTQQALIDRISYLEDKITKLDTQTVHTQTTLQALKAYEKVVYDKDWNAEPIPDGQEKENS